MKKRLWQSCFPVSFENIFKNKSFTEHLQATACDTSTNNEISKMKETKQKQKINVSTIVIVSFQTKQKQSLKY